MNDADRALMTLKKHTSSSIQMQARPAEAGICPSKRRRVPHRIEEAHHPPRRHLAQCALRRGGPRRGQHVRQLHQLHTHKGERGGGGQAHG